MKDMKEFVAAQLGEHTPRTQSTPVSFRCSDEVTIKMDLLLKYLAISTRSKLLSQLVPIALNDAIENLPQHMMEEFCIEYDKKMNEYYEYHATKDL